MRNRPRSGDSDDDDDDDVDPEGDPTHITSAQPDEPAQVSSLPRSVVSAGEQRVYWCVIYCRMQDLDLETFSARL